MKHLLTLAFIATTALAAKASVTPAEAFAEIKKKYVKHPVHLLLVGKGAQETQLKNLVKTLGLTQWVTFTGKIQQDLVPQYQNMIDIFVNILN